MGQYDEQLKKQAQKRKSGNADYGLYLKKNKDGTYSDNGRGKRKTSEDKAAYQSGEKKAPKSKLTSNVDDVLANARFVIDDPTVSFGSLEFDKNAFNRAAEKQKKWWEDTGSTHKTYGYDMSDPEDVLRAQEGRYSKAYEASYGKDELSQWLMEHGQASGSYFEQDYNEAAYEIMQEQQKAANLKNLRNEAIYEAWTAADNYENISGDDIAAAIQRLKLNNPDYADIEIVNPKIDVDEPDYSDYASPTLAEQTAAEKDAAKREDAIYLDDLIDEIEKLKGRQRELEAKQIAELEAQKQAETEAAKTAKQGAIDNAIRNSGFSAEVDNLAGLAKDSFSDSEYQANKDRKRAASTEAVNALMELGYSALEIRQIIGEDGRLSYIESEQGEKEESDRVQRMTDADTVLNDILSQGSPESQAAIERARKVGSGNNVMGTALREGFSPISMLSLTDEEIAYKDTYMDAVRTELAAQGFGDLEIDNAFRRADLEQYLDKDAARENYIRYVMGELGYDAEYTEAFIEKELSTDEGKAHYDKEMLASEFVENSTIDQIGNSISMIPVRAALDIVSSGVAAVDMVAANITGRKEMWQFTQDIEAEAAWAAAFSHDRNHEGLSVAADLGAEIVRMWATAQMGTKLAAGATKISPKTKGFSHLFNFIGKNGDKIPFVSNAMGSYYSEAMNQGANVKDATMYAIPAGLIEGMLESLEMGQVMQNSIGINFVGKKIAASGLPQSFKQLAVTKGLPFINFALDVLGEGIEEGVSALNASMLRTSTWDEYHELEMSDVWQNAKGGLILGGIMGGLSMPAHSQAYKYANAIYKDTGSLAKYLDSLQSAMHIENMDETRRNDLLDNVETTETTDADRENFINATVEIHNLTENIAAKKAAVEAAEQDAAVKVEAAEQKVADYKKRISVLRENNGKKKADKIKELSAQLNSAQKSAEQIRSESAKKVETAIADYKAVAAKANATIAKNQELIDKYHAAKYTADLEADIDSDIESVGNSVDESEYMERVANINTLLEAERAKLARLPQQQGKAALRRKEKIAHLEQRLASATDKYNASVAARTAKPTENTTAPINTAENRIDTVKTDVTEKRERIEFLKGEIMRKSLEYEAMPEPAEDSEDTEAVLRYEELGVELDNLEDELEALTAEVEAAETAEAEPTSTPAEAATESETVAPEPALKDLGANTPAPVEMKTRKSYSNTFDKAMSAVSNAVSKVSGTYYNEGSYAVSKEKDTLAYAQEAVRGELENAGTLAGLETRLSSREAWTAEDVDTAMIMAEVYEQEALETGNFTKLENLKRIIGEHLTEAGQVVQAMAKWSRTTNAGASVWVERTINKLNEKNADKIANGKANKITIPDDLKAKLAAAKTKAERDSVLAEIAAVIGQQIPPDAKSIFDSIRYLSMLGNVRTHVRNMLGNAMMRRVIQAKNVVGAGIESVAISDQSKRTKAVLSNSESDTALKEYASSTWDFVKHEFDGSKYSDGEKGFAKAVEDNRTIFKWSALEKLRKLNDAGLTLEDSWAAKKLYTSTFAQVMKARGLTADTITEAQKKEIAGIAINEAIKGTFHDANQFAKTMSKLENGSLFGKVFIGGTLPFKNTPINIAKRGVEYSPIGLIKGVLGDLPKVKKGEMSAAQAIDGIASGFVGTSLFAIGAFLAKAGILRGEGEDSDKEEYYRRDLGDQPYALYFGNKSYTIDWLSPAAMPLFMGVEFQKILSGESDSDNVFDAVLDFASQITNPLLQLSFLEGVNDTLTAAQESEYGMIVGAIANAPGNYLSQFIPTLSGQIARTIDPVRRNTSGDPTAEMGQEVDEYLNKIKAKISFLSSTLPAYVNAWGDEEVDDSHWAMRLIKNAISPGYSDERNYSDVDEEILRLFEATNSENILPSYYYTYRDLVRKGETYTLTNEEWTEFRKDWGMALYEAAEDAMNSSAYIAMTDDEKAKYLSDAMKSARDDIADKYKDKYLGK